MGEFSAVQVEVGADGAGVEEDEGEEGDGGAGPGGGEELVGGFVGDGYEACDGEGDVDGGEELGDGEDVFVEEGDSFVSNGG